jgi:hypothetical protein
MELTKGEGRRERAWVSGGGSELACGRGSRCGDGGVSGRVRMRDEGECCGSG